jgi:hypothetical protein
MRHFAVHFAGSLAARISRSAAREYNTLAGTRPRRLRTEGVFAVPKAKNTPGHVTQSQDEERRFFDKLYEEWIPLHAKRPSLVYHYTTAVGLLGIVQSHRLWATNARFLNDHSEIEYAAGVIRKVMAAMAGKGAARLPVDFTKLVNQDLDGFEAEARVYICCFCTEGDLLSQWRGYGAHGGGYALGFEAENFGDREVAMPPKPILRRVIYDAEMQERLVRPWLQAVCDLVVDRPAERGKFSSRMNILINTFRLLLPQFLLCFKNPAYAEEQEWRLIQYGRVSGQEIIKPAFRASGGRILPYVTLDLTEPEKYKGKLPLRVIRFGPTLDDRGTRRSLRLVLNSEGYSDELVKIEASGIPFGG